MKGEVLLQRKKLRVKELNFSKATQLVNGQDSNSFLWHLPPCCPPTPENTWLLCASFIGALSYHSYQFKFESETSRNQKNEMDA